MWLVVLLGTRVRLSSWFSASVDICLQNTVWSAHHASAGERQPRKKTHKAVQNLSESVCSHTSDGRRMFIQQHPPTIRKRERHEKPVGFQSEHAPSFQFPKLDSCAFDLVSSEQLSRTGHRMRAPGPGSSAGKKPGTSKRGQQEKLKPLVLGERRRTAYQGLIKPWRVICTVRPLRIGIKTEEVSARMKGRGGRKRERWVSKGAGVSEEENKRD